MKTDDKMRKRPETLFLTVIILLCAMLFATFLFLLNGCRLNADFPPVIVSKPVCLLRSAHNAFSHAGVSFECHNTGNSALSGLTVSFLVFSDSTGGNPFYGSNAVTAEIETVLPAGGSGTFEISLDDRLAFIPEKPFLIDYFYVSKALFADGTEWSDPAGFYYAGCLP